MFPAASVARAFSVCEPSPRERRREGRRRRAIQPPPSRSHSNVAGDSVEPRPKVGVACRARVRPGVGAKRRVRVRSGRPSRRALAGVASTLPAASSARTSNVCARLGQPAVRLRARAVARQAPPSSRHSKPGPASDAVNEKLALGRVRRGRRGGGDGRVRGRRVDREGERRRRRVDVAGGVDRAHLERVACSPRAGRV